MNEPEVSEVLAGIAIPDDMIVNESVVMYISRKLRELDRVQYNYEELKSMYLKRGDKISEMAKKIKLLEIPAAIVAESFEADEAVQVELVILADGFVFEPGQLIYTATAK